MNQTPATLRAFLTGLIDYAGLFPPASLPLAEALANFARYAVGDDQWMLGRFIVPIGRLPHITDTMMQPFTEANPLHLSLLSGDMAGELPLWQSFCERYNGRITTTLLETRLPLTDRITPTLKNNAQLLANAGFTMRIFYELPFNADWDTRLSEVIQAIADYNRDTGDNAGFKLRCGGVEPHMFPTPAQIARAIRLCQDADVTMKCTAGLHHPIRHFNEEVSTKMHGFINVFGAGILAAAHNLPTDDIQRIIEEEDAAQFVFSADAFCWRDTAVSLTNITHTRHIQQLSYGSCSFDEPRQDLQALGWLNPARARG
jgi:hypothetical protein